MQTIIYTNNKREAANYHTDKICSTEKIDLRQLIEDEMHHYNIKNIHFWFVSNNVNNLEGNSEEKILISMGRYLAQNRESQLSFQYLIEKYTEISKQGETQTPDNLQRHSTYSPLRSIKEQPLQPQRQSEDSSIKPPKAGLSKEELLREDVKFSSFRQFQLFVFKEHQNKSNSDLNILKTYIFKIRGQIIRISFIQQNKKNLLKKIVDQNCDIVYNAKLLMKKRLTMAEFNNKAQKDATIPTFHNKLILFLFHNDKEKEKESSRKPTKVIPTSISKPNYATEALEEWRIKEQNIDHFAKLEKECEIVKREIEQEKISFRNKVRTIEHYLGDNINVEKLINEEDDQNGHFSFTTNSSFKPEGRKNSRSSKVLSSTNPMFGNALFNPTTSQFKRIKDIADSIRNTQNVLQEQNKKIELSKKQLKSLVKSRETLIFEQAKQMNQLKSQILALKGEIARKNLEIKERQKNGTYQQTCMLKNKKPTSQAENCLNNYVKFMSTLTKPQQKPEQPISVPGSKHDISSVEQSPRNMKKSNNFSIKKGSQTVHQNMIRHREAKLKEVKKTIEKEAEKKSNTQKLKKEKLNKQFAVNDARLDDPEPFTEFEDITQTELVNSVLLEQLVELYRYYNQNKSVIALMKKDIGSYGLLYQKPFLAKSYILNERSQKFERMRLEKIKAFDIKDFQKIPEVELASFPLLSQYFQRRNALQASEKVPIIVKSASNSNTKAKKSLFQTMMAAERKQMQVAVFDDEPASSDPPEPSLKVSQSSMNSEVIDHIIQNSMLSKTHFRTASKNKRMTIEEAINFNNNMRFSSFQRAK